MLGGAARARRRGGATSRSPAPAGCRRRRRARATPRRSSWACASARTPRSSTRSAGACAVVVGGDGADVRRACASATSSARSTRASRFELASAGATESHPLILFGPNAVARRTRTPGERRLAAGDVVCADVSARIGGYWADLTRCATVGPPSDWAQRTWSRRARRAGRGDRRRRASARPRRTSTPRSARSSRPRRTSARACTAPGHAMGTEIHEPPFLVPGRDAPLAAGNVLTIEPGLYAEGVGGIRLEDDVAVTDGEPVLLSDMPLALRELAGGTMIRRDAMFKRWVGAAAAGTGGRRVRRMRIGRRAAAATTPPTRARRPRSRRSRSSASRPRTRSRRPRTPASRRRPRSTTSRSSSSIRTSTAPSRCRRSRTRSPRASTRPSSCRPTTATRSCRRSARRSTRASRSSASSRRSAPSTTRSSRRSPGLIFVGEPPTENGTALGEMGVDACKGMDPCNVAYLEGFKALPLDNARTDAVKAALAAGAERQARRVASRAATRQDTGLKAAQNVLQAHPDVERHDRLLAGDRRRRAGGQGRRRARSS